MRLILLKTWNRWTWFNYYINKCANSRRSNGNNDNGVDFNLIFFNSWFICLSLVLSILNISNDNLLALLYFALLFINMFCVFFFSFFCFVFEFIWKFLVCSNQKWNKFQTEHENCEKKEYETNQRTGKFIETIFFFFADNNEKPTGKNLNECTITRKPFN